MTPETPSATSPVPGDHRPDPVGSHRDEAGQLVAAMTREEKLWCLDGDAPFWAGIAYLGQLGYHKSPFRAARVERLGFPGFAFADGPRGVVVDQATCFPVSMARGASFDPELEERIGDVIGRELRAVGADLYGGVCVNVLRHPAWGRAQETYGEDPHHVGILGAALVRGVQRHAMACVKHFAANSMENARFAVDVTIGEAALHEVYLPHFRRIVDEGVAVVMSAYNSLNGAWCGENSELLTDILRHEWGFTGVVISDWILGLRDAGRSLSGGLDVEMPYRMIRAGHLEAALAEGRCTWAEVDESVTRTVATVLRFAPVLESSAEMPRSVLASPGHRDLAREAAARSMVLLRNEEVDSTPVLPLDPASLSSLAVIGPLADLVNLGDGGSSDVWAPDVVTPWAGLEERLSTSFPHVAVHLDDGSDPDQAAEAARKADVAIVVVGYTRDDEGEFIGEMASGDLTHLFPGPDDPELAAAFQASIATESLVAAPDHVTARGSNAMFSTGGDRRSLRLPPAQVALIRAVAAANRRVVVVMVAGSAVVVSEWDEEVPAILLAWYSGMEGGRALADVLTGECDANGRLPFSIPTDESHLVDFDPDATVVTYDEWHGYWHLARQGVEPAYPFGFGLSYTDFHLVDSDVVVVDGTPTVRATVANPGDRPGRDLVLVFAQHVDSGRPMRLVGFSRVAVPADGEATVTLAIDRFDLEIRDEGRHQMVVEPGLYRWRVARHASDPGQVHEVSL